MWQQLSRKCEKRYDTMRPWLSDMTSNGLYATDKRKAAFHTQTQKEQQTTK